MFSPFDTLRFATQLRTGGFTQQQADTLTSSLQEALGATVATKADLNDAKAELKAELKTELNDAKAELKAELNDTKAELKADIAATEARLDDAKAELKAELNDTKAELKADIAANKTDIVAVQRDMAKGFQDVYKFMVVSTLTIVGTLIGTAVALVRYLAP